MSSRLEKVRQHPLHQLLGVKSIEAAEGRSRLSIEVGGPAINPAGVLHGGVVYTLCDVAAYAALVPLLDESEEAVTHDIHVSVLRPASAGDVVVFEGSVIRRGKAIAFLETIASVGDRQLARATVTKSIVPAMRRN